MYLIHRETKKYPDGIIEISVTIVNEKDLSHKNYTYSLNSEYVSRQFHSLLRMGKKLHGSALTLLNKSKIKTD
uniref:Uncharacterized protein n=1 Tax=viral metagenome TaxID=1070528 RepID=A0A6M3K6U9_9ZZZZ